MRIKSVSLNDLDRDKCHIKIALLGNVSAGKTTFLNALLMDKYGEVSMNRCTASISYFHFGSVKSKVKNTENKKSADTIHQEISASNKILRKQAKIEEKHFLVEGKEHFVTIDEELSPDIIIVDVPGLNENSTSEMYKDYVKSKFHTFNMIIIVIDATQGVNTTEQVDLLKFVNKCSQEIRNIPIMVAMNKVDPDEKDNEELGIMIMEIEKEVSKIFRSDIETRAIPISAEYSYIYRSASKLRIDEFASSFKNDSKCINKIGKEEFGRKWKKMAKDDKIKSIYDIIKNKDEYEERLKDCNFHLVLNILEDFIGKKEQRSLINKQIQFMLQNISISNNDSASSDLGAGIFYDQMIECIKNTKALGMFDADCVKEYRQRFWNLWEEAKESALIQFKINPEVREWLVFCGHIVEMYGTEMLSEFYGVGASESKMNDLQKAKRKFKSLIVSKNEIIWANAVYHQYGFKHKNVSNQVTCSSGKQDDEAYWHKLSPGDWHFLLVSSSLVSFDATFVYELASSIAQMRHHELQFSKMSEGCFHSVEAEEIFAAIEFELYKLKKIPKIPIAAISASCVKCDEKTQLTDFGFCSKCKRCGMCGASGLIRGTNCHKSSGCRRKGGNVYCSSCELCNGCGQYISNYPYFHKFSIATSDKLTDSYKKALKSIDIETLRETSWFKPQRRGEPLDKKLKTRIRNLPW